MSSARQQKELPRWCCRAVEFVQSRAADVLVFAAAILLYANTVNHGFVLDDGLVLEKNKYVQRGLAGIPDLLRHDSFHGSIGTSEFLSGGRYRPLSLMLFALEVELFGMRAEVHHLFHILWYGVVCTMVLFWLRQFVFPTRHGWAIAAALLFVVHPVHTEVVANIKSRDELLSLFFLLACLMQLDGEVTNGRWPVISGLWFFLALLSKENGLIFTILIPLWLLWVRKIPPKHSLLYATGFWLIAVFYLLLRNSATPLRTPPVTEVMDHPYLLATAEQKLATIAVVFLTYLKLLFFPHPLTYDYSYHQIPYANFHQPLVWVSVAVHLLIVAVAFGCRTRYPVFSWCIVFYLMTLLLVSNLFFNVGTPLAERFLFQASLPFIAAVSWITSEFLSRLPVEKRIGHQAALLLLMTLLVLCSFVTVKRSAVWKDNRTLLLHDVHISSQSGRANTYAGIALIAAGDSAQAADKNNYYLQAVAYLKRALAIQPTYLPALLNLGVAYSRLDSLPQAAHFWLQARQLSPENKTLKKYFTYLFAKSFQLGIDAGIRKQYDSAVLYLTLAVAADSTHAEAWYNLGGAQFETGRFGDALNSFERCLALQPAHQAAQRGKKAAQYYLEQAR
ncbi:MAG: tetratricopeptide repeat protein [Chitinophagales bacterium]|nr:tetratricopeptide repeat protein [Chitinophagales bacterium]MDW8427678.1 tetratricopeptide repeat protein [Chitinophagales bacterium]